MKKELLQEGLRCKMTRMVTDHEGAVYENDIVRVVDWTDVKTNDDGGVVVFVIDDVGKHHTVSLNDIKPL